MIIKTLTLSGIKACDRTIELAPLTLISGPNASGKTTILDAIRFVLMGQVPGMGKTNQALFDLSSGAHMSGTVAMSNGDTFDRGLKLNGSKVTAVALSPCPEHLLTPCLDPELYFSLPESQRVQYIFDHCKVDGSSPEAIIAKVSNAITWDEMTEERVKAKAEVTSRLTAMAKKEGSIQEILESMAETLRDTFKSENAAAAESQGAVTTLTELRLSSEQTFASVPELEQRQAALQKTLAELNQQQGALIAKKESNDRIAARKEKLESIIANPVPTEEQVSALEAAAKAATDAAEAAQLKHKDAPKSDVAGANAAVVAKHGDVMSANSALAGARSLMDIAQAEVNCLSRSLEQLEAQECCPHCESVGDGWKAKLRAKDQEKLAKANTELEAARIAHEDAIQRLSAANAAHKNAQQKLDAQRQIAQEAEYLIHDERVKIAEATNAVAAVERLKQLRAEQIVRRVDAEQELKNLALEAYDSQALTELLKQSGAADLEMADIAAKLAIANRTKNDLLRAEQAAKKHQQHAASRDALKMAGKEVVAIKASLVADAFKVLLERANQVTGDLLKSPLAYNSECNELGRYRGHTFVKHRTFSGTEKALAYIGLSVALAWDSEFRIVLLDEVSRLTFGNQQVIMDRLQDLVENDVIHQAIVVEPNEEHRDMHMQIPWELVSTAEGTEVVA